MLLNNFSLLSHAHKSFENNFQKDIDTPLIKIR